LIKLIGSLLSQRKFKVSVEGEISTPRVMKAGMPQGSVLSPTLFNMYINDAPQTHGVHLTLFADDTCLYVTDRKECLLLENSSAVSAQRRRGVSAGITKLIRIRLGGSTSLVVVDRLSLTSHKKWTRYSIYKYRKISRFIFDKKVTWRLHIEIMNAKAFRTFFRIYFLFKSERLSTNFNLIFHKVLIRSIMTYACPSWEFAADRHLL
jgi:hypothetical protein